MECGIVLCEVELSSDDGEKVEVSELPFVGAAERLLGAVVV